MMMISNEDDGNLCANVVRRYFFSFLLGFTLLFRLDLSWICLFFSGHQHPKHVVLATLKFSNRSNLSIDDLFISISPSGVIDDDDDDVMAMENVWLIFCCYCRSLSSVIIEF